MSAERAFVLEQRRLVGSLSEFTKAAWHVLEPDVQLSWSFHHDLLCEHLELIARGEFRKRFRHGLLRRSKDTLVDNSPPRDGKSTVVSIAFPVWCWLSKPGMRFLCASYNQQLATDLSIRRRTLIRSHWFQQRFGSFFRLADDTDRAHYFANDYGGFMLATSPEGLGTGMGGDVLICDDPLSAEDSYSGTIRQQTIRWFKSTWSTRRNNPATGMFILVCQRLHEDDLCGHLLANDPQRCVHLKVPLEAEDDEDIVFPSGRVHHRAKGDILEPDRFTPEVVASLKLDRLAWASQFQQRPAPSEGTIVRRDSIQFWRSLPAFDEVLQSWDCTFKDTSKSDFVAGHVWGRAGANYYLLDRVHDRADFTATLSAIRTLTAKWPQAVAVLIEDKANGPAVITTLKDEISGLIAVNPEGGKEARLRAISPLFEARNVYVPDPTIAPWVHDVIEEWCAFPFARHDDDVDAMSQALLRLRLHGGTHPLVAYLKSGMAERDLDQFSKPLPASRPVHENALAAAAQALPPPKPAVTCPKCSSERVTRVSGQVHRCLACSAQFDAPSKFQVERGFSRADILMGRGGGRWMR